MTHGKVAQIGRPRDIYFSPANGFVANFIGTLNRLEGRVQDGMLVVAGGRLALPGAHRETAAVFFRPEDVEIRDGAPEAMDVLCGTVAGASFLGDRTRLLVEGVGSNPVVLETDTRREFHPGDSIRFRIAQERLLHLDGETAS
jgi:putative spermidine/putrescine transport system ATP-binding protein